LFVVDVKSFSLVNERVPLCIEFLCRELGLFVDQLGPDVLERDLQAVEVVNESASDAPVESESGVDVA
jgi:hypothetical protein